MTAHDTAFAPAQSLDPVPPLAGKRFVDIFEDLSTDADRIKNLVDVVYDYACTDFSPQGMAVLHCLEEFAEKHRTACGIAVDEAMRRERLVESATPVHSPVFHCYGIWETMQAEIQMMPSSKEKEIDGLVERVNELHSNIVAAPVRSLIDLACKVRVVFFNSDGSTDTGIGADEAARILGDIEAIIGAQDSLTSGHGEPA